MSSDRRQDQRRAHILRHADPERERIFPCAGRASSPHVSRQRLHGCSLTSTTRPANPRDQPGYGSPVAGGRHLLCPRLLIGAESPVSGLRTVRSACWSRWLMARTVSDDPRLVRPGLAVRPLICAFSVERVTESNPHYQLGNLYRPGRLCGLTCGTGCPRVTVRDRPSPGLMAR